MNKIEDIITKIIEEYKTLQEENSLLISTNKTQKEQIIALEEKIITQKEHIFALEKQIPIPEPILDPIPESKTISSVKLDETVYLYYTKPQNTSHETPQLNCSYRNTEDYSEITISLEQSKTCYFSGRQTIVSEGESLAFAVDEEINEGFTDTHIIDQCFTTVYCNCKFNELDKRCCTCDENKLVFGDSYTHYIDDKADQEPDENDPSYYGNYKKYAYRYIIPYKVLLSLSLFDENNTFTFNLNEIPTVLQNMYISEDFIGHQYYM
jgi:hypothetical protein